MVYFPAFTHTYVPEAHINDFSQMLLCSGSPRKPYPFRWAKSGEIVHSLMANSLAPLVLWRIVYWPDDCVENDAHGA